MQSYKDLQVWNRSMALVKDIYSLTNKFPSSERFGLTSQIQRSAVSVPSNIAEGRLRAGEKSFIQFLFIALGSCAELQTQIIIAKEIGYTKNTEAKKIEEDVEVIMKMINNLIKKLKANG